MSLALVGLTRIKLQERERIASQATQLLANLEPWTGSSPLDEPDPKTKAIANTLKRTHRQTSLLD